MFYLISFELEVGLKFVNSHLNFAFLCPVYVLPLLSHKLTLFKKTTKVLLLSFLLLLSLLLLLRHRFAVDCWCRNWFFLRDGNVIVVIFIVVVVIVITTQGWGGLLFSQLIFLAYCSSFSM